MKKIISLCMLLVPLLASAQFNEWFEPSSITPWHYSQTKTPVFNLNTRNIYFTAYDDVNHVLLLVRTDLSGVYQNHIALSGHFADHEIIATKDDGIVLAIHDNGYINVLKFNTTLSTTVFSRRFETGPDPVFSGGVYADNSVAIGRRTDEGTGIEHFYITSIAPSQYPTYHPDDVAFDVLDVKDNGVLQKHANYAPNPVSRDTVDPTIVDWLDFIHDIVVTDDQIYLAAVHLQKSEVTGGSCQLFFLSLDNSGTANLGIKRTVRMATTNDASVRVPKIIYDPTIWDNIIPTPPHGPSTGTIACSYTAFDEHGNKRIGFLRLGVFPNGGTMGSPNTGVYPTLLRKYQIFDQTDGLSISEVSSGNYLIGNAMNNRGVTFPGLMGITPIGGVSGISTSYSQSTDHDIVGYHITNAADDNFQLSLRNPSSGNSQFQIINTDVNLDACGVDEVFFDREEVTPSALRINYHVHLRSEQEDFQIEHIEYDLEATFCDEENPFERMAQPLAVAASEADAKAVITPTVLNEPAPLSCTVTIPEATNVQIMIYSSFGQVLYNKTQMLPSGLTKLTLPSELLSTGINIVKVVGNGKVISTTKVTSL